MGCFMNIIFTIMLVVGVVACGAPVAEVRAVKDQRYSMSLKKVADQQDRYHFQICRLGDRQWENPCFNPFVVDGEKELEFVGKPDAKYLQLKGVTKKSARYTVKVVATVILGAVALIFVPKTVRYSFNKLFEMGMESRGTQVAKAFRQDIRENEIISKAKGKPWTEEMIEKEKKKYRMFDSKWIKILTSLFIVEGAFEAVDILYDLYKDLDRGLANGQWGDKELELAKVYPQLLSDSDDEATVKDLTRIADTLRQHLGLAFSDAYLMEFAGTTN